MDQIVKFAAPIGRALMSFIFIVAGAQKIFAYAGTAAYMESQGVPGALLPLVILLELAGGMALLLGWRAREAAFLLGGFSVIAGIIFHLLPGFGMEGMAQQTQMIMFMKNLAIAGGMAMVVHAGPGAFALDNRRAAEGRASAA